MMCLKTEGQTCRQNGAPQSPRSLAAVHNSVPRDLTTYHVQFTDNYSCRCLRNYIDVSWVLLSLHFTPFFVF